MDMEPRGPGGEGEVTQPQPLRAPWVSALGGFAISAALVVGAGLMLPLFAPCHQTCGAPRSVHLERQKRQQQAREAAEREATGQENAGDDARPEPGD
ncbi:MAG TPA: hypothetical protein VNE39_20185 [Planctomycetota bacterium]|nr:hypothetical protein [Planctomycetota bacterium]